MLMMAAMMCMSISTLLVPPKYLWPVSMTQSFFIAFESIRWLYISDAHPTNSMFFIDEISAPLVVLTCWLLPLTLMASQSLMQFVSVSHQRLFILCIILLQMFTFLTFIMSDLMTFFILYEASLIPMLIIITRWGGQERRLEAGTYIVYYTLLGAIPLFMWMLDTYTTLGSLSFMLIKLLPPLQTQFPTLYWIMCNTAFLMKLPMYCLHLWLPKAHVEAPVAGSMILAGTMLKLGGYGLLRVSPLMQEASINHTMVVFLVATFGVLATAMLCLRQTDFKSLIAMSSVSHMNLFIIAAIISTPFSYIGAIIMMISHGLTSSAMFCLVNLTYERTNTRTMVLLRGALLIFPLTSLWWLLISLANMAFPPTINFASELMIMFALHNWSPLAFLTVALNLIFTTAYTLYIFWSTQRGSTPEHLKSLPPTTIREHLLLALHLLPALMMVFKTELLVPMYS